MQGILAKWKQNKGLIAYSLYLDRQYFAVNSTFEMSRGRFQAGHKAKHSELPFISELRCLGYDYKNLPKILGVSHLHYIRLFQEPERFTIKQITILSYLLNEPIPKLLNTFLRTQPQSPHYLKEDYSTNSHVEKIKAELATKLSKDQSEPK